MPRPGFSQLSRALGGLALAALMAVLAPPISADSPTPPFEEIVSRLIGVNESLYSFKVEQIIDVRILFLRYRVLSTVYAARPARYRVEMHNMPWLLRPLGSVFSFVGRPEDVLQLYVPTRIEWQERDGSRYLHLDLVKQQDRVNPPRAEALIDPRRWLFEQMVLHYDWGTVYAHYRFETVAGYYLPSTVRVQVPSYRVSAVVTYERYQLNVPLAEELFNSK